MGARVHTTIIILILIEANTMNKTMEIALLFIDERAFDKKKWNENYWNGMKK